MVYRLFENLKTARKAAGLSQEEVAKRVGVTQQAYSLFEKGFKMPSVVVLCALADALETTTDKLLGRKI